MQNTTSSPRSQEKQSNQHKKSPKANWRDNCKQLLSDGSPFHCSAEWHLSPLAAKIYSWSRKISKKSGTFSAAEKNVAIYFGVHKNTVLQAYKEIADLGLWQLVRIEYGKPNVYRPVDHKKWAEKHPGCCVKKLAMPWEGEGDRLAVDLHAASGNRVKFLPNQTTGLRKLGFSDELIVKEFSAFLDGEDYEGKQWKRAYYDFLEHLKTLPAVVAPENANSGSTSLDPATDADVVSNDADTRSDDHNQLCSTVTTQCDQPITTSCAGRSQPVVTKSSDVSLPMLVADSSRTIPAPREPLTSQRAFQPSEAGTASPHPSTNKEKNAEGKTTRYPIEEVYAAQKRRKHEEELATKGAC